MGFHVGARLVHGVHEGVEAHGAKLREATAEPDDQRRHPGAHIEERWLRSLEPFHQALQRREDPLHPHIREESGTATLRVQDQRIGVPPAGGKAAVPGILHQARALQQVRPQLRAQDPPRRGPQHVRQGAGVRPAAGGLPQRRTSDCGPARAAHVSEAHDRLMPTVSLTARRAAETALSAARSSISQRATAQRSRATP